MREATSSSRWSPSGKAFFRKRKRKGTTSSWQVNEQSGSNCLVGETMRNNRSKKKMALLERLKLLERLQRERQTTTNICLSLLIILLLLLPLPLPVMSCQQVVSAAKLSNTKHRLLQQFDANNSTRALNLSSGSSIISAAVESQEEHQLTAGKGARIPVLRITRSTTNNNNNAGASTRVVAVGGQWVELRCPLSSELLAGDSSQSIVWRKNGVRLNQLEPRQKIHAQNGSLIIADAQPQLDEANYECALLTSSPATGASSQQQQQQRELKSHKFQLKLVVAPRLAPFEFPADAQVGMKLVLTCSALEGQQPISFVWLKDNQIIRSSSVSSSSNEQQQVNQHLLQQEPSSLNQLHQRQLADKLLASGQSTTGKSEYMLLLPAEPAPNEQLVQAQVGAEQQQQQQQQELLALLSDSNIRIRQSDDYSMLSIERLELKHSGRYTCSAQNELARSSHSAQLLINAPPTLSVEPQDSDLVSGQSALLDCQASGQPRPSVSWLRARESASSKLWDYVAIYDNLRYTTLPNGSLSITNVTQREQGFYLCSAKNGFGPEVTKLIKITVHEPARFGPKYKTLEVRIGERANMLCAASGEPPVKLEWLDKSSNVIQSIDKRFILDNNDPADNELSNSNLTVSRLILTHSSSAHSGHYTCQASNKYGADKMVTNLLVQDVPDKVTELKVTNATSATISLRWQLNFNGNSPVTSYLVQYQSDDPFDDLRPTADQVAELTNNQQQQQTNSALKVVVEALNLAANANDELADEAIDRTLVELTVEQSATNLIVKDLSPYCVYRLRLAAINKIGLGQFSDWIRAKTEEAPPSGVPLKISAAATGPNSIKLTWNPPDRRQWNGQLVAFNIGYRSLDSSFSLNKTVEWSAPSLQSMVQNDDKQQQQHQVTASSAAAPIHVMHHQGSAIAANLSQLLAANKSSSLNSASESPTIHSERRKSSNETDKQYLMLRQHLRQLLALQQQELVAHLTNLQRSTTYLVWIQAINQRGYGPQSHSVSVKTLDDVPPSAPALKVQSTSSTSITITWSMLSNFVSSANQYSLFYRRIAQAGTSSSFGVPPNHSPQQPPPPPPPPTVNSSNLSSVVADLSLPAIHHHFSDNSEAFIERTISSQQLMLNSNGGSSSNMLQAFNGNSNPSLQQPDHLFSADQQVLKPSFMHQQTKHFQQFVYTLDQLECGSVYELYMTTRNSVGKSEPSPVLTTRTMGEPPIAPNSKSNLFARVGSSEVSINLAAWSAGGCPLTHITVRYKQSSNAQSSSSLTTNSSSTAIAAQTTTTSVPVSLLSSVNNLLMSQQSLSSHSRASIDPPPVYTLRNLASSTFYELEISAYNSAGQTTALYEFVTLNSNGSRVRLKDSASGSPLSFRFSEQRHLEGLANDGGDLEGSVRFVELQQQHQASSANSNGIGNNLNSNSNNQQSWQLLPLLLMLLCLMCLIISSSFCYYKLKASFWKSHSRSSSSNGSTSSHRTTGNNVNARNLHCQQPMQTTTATTGKVATDKSSVWRLNNGAQQSIRRHNNSNNHSSLLKHRQQHQDTFIADNDDSDTNNSPLTHYCLREPTASNNQLMNSTVGLKSSSNHHQHLHMYQQPANGSSFVSQSVSMKDFNLITEQRQQALQSNDNVNFRTYRNPSNRDASAVAAAAAKTATMRARLISSGEQPVSSSFAAEEAATISAANNSLQQDYSSTGIDHNQLCSIYAAACKQQQQQHETYVNQAAASRPTLLVGNNLQQQQQQGYLDSHYEPHQCSYSADGQQQETSWTTAPLTGFIDQQQQQKTNYAIPSTKYADHQQLNSNYNDSTNPDQQLVYSRQQQDTYGQSSIDACIQQLMGQQYRQQQQQQQEQQQQYAMIVNVKLDPAANRCLYVADSDTSHQLNHQIDDQVKLAANNLCENSALVNSTAQSVVESSVGSSSSGIDIGQSNIDCASSSATGTSNSNTSNDGYQLSHPPQPITSTSAISALPESFNQHLTFNQTTMQEIDLKHI